MKALYRIVAAVIVLLTFPALYFQKAIRVVMELNIVDGFFDDSFAISDFVNFVRDYNIQLSSESFTFTERIITTLQPLKAPAITALVFLCVALVMVFAVFFCSVFTNAKKVNLVFSAIGAVGVIGTIASFNSMADIVISGELPLTSILDAVLADSENLIASIAGMLGAGSLLNVIGELKIFQLSSAFTIFLFIFIFEILWSLSFILISLDEAKTPKAEKAKKKK